MGAFSTLLALLVTVHQNIYNLEVMKKFKYELQSEFGNICIHNLVIVFDKYVFSLVVIKCDSKSIAIALSFSQCIAH